jgi:hypothetical protein
MSLTLPAKMIIFSHLSDIQELVNLEGNPTFIRNRINFVKYLLNEYPDVTVGIDPEKEYEKFINQYPNMKF